MSSNLDFSVNRDNHSILVKREFAAELPLVWDAYTKSELLEKWWAPKPWKAKTKSMDFREGGSWLYAMVGPEGGEHWAMSSFRKIQPQKQFTVEDAFTDDKGNVNKEMPGSTWVVTFIDKGPVTVVEHHITYADLAQLEAYIKMGFKEGFIMALENLDEVLAQKA